MTVYYVDSNKTGGTDAGTSWTNAYLSINSIPTLSSGDVVQVHTGTTPHNESNTTSKTITGPSSGAPAYIIGVDSSDDSYLQATTTNITKTGAGALTFDGSLVWDGVNVKTSAAMLINIGDWNEAAYFRNMEFDQQSTYMYTGSANEITFENVDFIFGTNGYFYQNYGGHTSFHGGSATGSKTYMFDINNGQSTFCGVDLSGYTGSACFDAAPPTSVDLIGCSLPTNLYATSIDSQNLRIYGSDVTATHNQWRYERIFDDFGTTAISESVYRSGGATYDGTNEYSITLATGTYNSLGRPVYTDWNTGYLPADSGTTTTWTVYITNATGDTYNDEVWLEVEYYASSTSTAKTITSSRINGTALGTGISHTINTDDTTSTWQTVNTYKQKLTRTGTVAKAGMYRWRVASAYSSNTIYVDPAISAVQA